VLLLSGKKAFSFLGKKARSPERGESCRRGCKRLSLLRRERESSLLHQVRCGEKKERPSFNLYKTAGGKKTPNNAGPSSRAGKEGLFYLVRKKILEGRVTRPLTKREGLFQAEESLFYEESALG